MDNEESNVAGNFSSFGQSRSWMLQSKPITNEGSSLIAVSSKFKYSNFSEITEYFTSLEHPLRLSHLSDLDCFSL
jgi:hypothetical protein